MRIVPFLESFALLAFGVSAATISEYLGNTGALLNEYHFGQAVRTPSGGPWHNIVFSFPGGASFEPGTLYLLSEEYLGLPSLLPSAPGLIAKSIAAPGHGWAFASSVILQPNSGYYFYEDGTRGAISQLPSDPMGPLRGYMTEGFPNLDTPFHRTSSMNFELTGDPVPEPPSLTLLAPVLLLALTARESILSGRSRSE